MQRFRLSLSILASLALLHAAKKPLPGEADNEKVEVVASVVPNDQVNQSFGYDFQNHFTVIEVRLTPKLGPLDVKLDDFLLRSDRDGDRSTPFPATQITGDGALVMAHATASAGPTGNTTDRGWRLPGGLGSGNGARKNKKKTEAPEDSQPAVKIDDSKTDPDLKAKVVARVLPEKSATEPTSGLLFFPLEKQKSKDLELIYTTTAGKLHLRFK